MVSTPAPEIIADLHCLTRRKAGGQSLVGATHVLLHLLRPSTRGSGRKGSLAMRALFFCLALTSAGLTAPSAAAQKVELSVDASKTGAKIDRQIFGQFAEHLGKGVYEGVWVGPNSTIPNTRGIRNDVVAALRALKVPNVRWPGGCFADEYHWRKGIGPAA